MWHVIWHAIEESLLMLPILVATYLVIELIEIKSAKSLKNSRFLKGKWAPVVGGGIGLVPQCGFSVVATDLYTKKAISVGTLLAVYIATSDEALPLLIANPSSFKEMWIILAVKFAMAIIMGYGANLFVKYFSKPKNVYTSTVEKGNFVGVGLTEVKHAEVEKRYLVAEVEIQPEPERVVKVQQHVDKGCCGHAIEQENGKFNFWKFVYHPVVHSLKIFAFVVIINILFALLLHYVGQDVLSDFLAKGKFVQPLIAGLVGLIPNCASSVVITKLFINGGLTLGACITGLSVNAGIAYTLLVKQNENKKHAFYIILANFVFSLIIGMIISLF